MKASKKKTADMNFEGAVFMNRMDMGRAFRTIARIQSTDEYTVIFKGATLKEGEKPDRRIVDVKGNYIPGD